jgi:type VI secretion system secreted protein Hcp
MPLLPVTEHTTKSNYDLHLNLSTIQGESTSALHNQEIEITSFSWGASNSAVRSAQGSPKGGKPTVSEMTVTKRIDKASPQLFNALVSSTLIKTAILSMSKSTGGGKIEDHFVITMTGVYVTSLQVTHSRDMPEHQKGAETVTLNFQKVSIDYKVQLVSGLLAQGASASYDLTVGT